MPFYKKKICLLGDVGVGKTSLIRRFVENIFDENYLSTIGVRVSQKEVVLSPELSLLLLIWDVEGANAAEEMNRTYLTGASGALVVSDLTRPDTIDFSEKLIDLFGKINPQSPIILAGNKTDLVEKDHLSFEILEACANKNGLPFFQTSAKNGEKVENCFEEVARNMLDIR